MSRISTSTQRTLRVLRTRTKLKGTTERPRLAVRVSNKAIEAQIIDDSTSKTIFGASGSKAKSDELVKAIAAGAKKHKVTAVVFDRGAKQYHGVIANIADGLRKEGINL